MITLNLLPPQKKEEIRLIQLYVVIKNLIIIILFFTIIIAIVLLFTKMTLQNYFNKIVGQTTLTTKYSRLFNQDIKIFNKQLAEVDNIQKNHIIWTKFFIEFSKIVPAETTIYDLNINEDKILISGFSKSRARLLEFKNNLENSPLFSEITVPLENLLKKENLNFDIKANLKLEELKD